MKYTKWIVLPLVTLALLSGLVAGILRFGLPENKTTAREISNSWHYETNLGQTGEILLPWDLAVPVGTGQIRITTTLPQWEDEGYALHFSTIQQAVEVQVDGETRYTYGAAVDEADFVYYSASHINRVPLSLKDSGKELTIIYSATPLFRIELGLIREVWFGTESDLVIHQFVTSLPFMLTAVFALLSVLSTLLMLSTYRGAPLRANVCTLLLTLIVILPFSAEFSVLWPVLHHAPKLSFLYDWNFFFFDALIAPTAWLVMYASGWNFRGWRGRAALCYGYAFVIAVILSLNGLFQFNLTRPPFMVYSMLLTIFLLIDQKKHGDSDIYHGLALPALVLLGGYYLDYIKYCLMAFPISGKWSVFLQLKLSFQFFTSIALVIFSMLALRVTMTTLVNRRSAAREETLKLQNDQQLLRQSSLAMTERLHLMDEAAHQQSIVAHDRRHFNSTILELLEQGHSQDVIALLKKQTDRSPQKNKYYCENTAINAAVTYYVSLAQSKGIITDINLDIPSNLIIDSLELALTLSNLLENAIHGCEVLPETAPKRIHLVCHHVGRLVLEISNPCTSNIMLDKNGYPTSSLEGHGIGTKSVLAFATKYDGELFYRIENGIFTVRLLV